MKLRRLISILLCAWLAGCQASTDTGLAPFPEPFPPAGPLRVPQDFATITEAVFQASAGDTVVVSPGVYNESVPVFTPIILQGSGHGTVIQAEPGLPALLVGAGAQVTGMTLRGGTQVLTVANQSSAVKGVELSDLLVQATQPDGSGLLFQNAPDIRITDCRVEAHSLAVGGGLFGGPSPGAVLERVTAVLLGQGFDAIGIFLGNTPGARLIDCVVQGPDDPNPRSVLPLPFAATGLLAGDLEGAEVPGLQLQALEVDLPGDETTGIVLGNMPGARLSASVVAGVNGIVVENSDGAIVENFSVELSGPNLFSGVRVVESDNLMVGPGNVTGGTQGVQLVGPMSAARVEDVAVSGVSFLGIAGFDVTDPEFLGASVEGGAFGIALLGSSSARVAGNRVIGAGTGIHFEAVNTDPEIANNQVGGTNIAVNFFEPPTGALVVENALAANNFGVAIGGGDATLLRNRLDGNFFGVDAFGDALLLATNNLVLNSLQTGVLAEGVSLAFLYNNVFAGNVFGAGAVGQASLEAVGNIFFANQVALDVTGTVGPAVSDFNDYFGNTLGDGPLGIPAGPGDLAVDPQFADTVNFALTLGSPVIDAGPPVPAFNDQIPPGQGGPRNDMGAYGGPQAGPIPAPLVVPPPPPRHQGRSLLESYRDQPSRLRLSAPETWRIR